MTEKNRGSSDDNGLCCCCFGLALGYLLFHSNAHGATTNLEHNVSRISTNSTTDISSHPTQDSFLLRQITDYQTRISPQIKRNLGRERLCRFEPSCSEYARQAIETYGPVKGVALASSRLLRCNPLSKGGYDPVKKPEDGQGVA